MLAYYLEWHMRQRLAPMLFADAALVQLDIELSRDLLGRSTTRQRTTPSVSRSGTARTHSANVGSNEIIQPEKDSDHAQDLSCRRHRSRSFH